MPTKDIRILVNKNAKENRLGMDWNIQSEGFSCELEEIQAGGIALAKAVLSAGTPAVPHRITLSFRNWLPARSSSRITAEAPVLSLFTRRGKIV